MDKIELFVKDAVGEMDIGGFLVPSINAPIVMLDELKPILLEGNKLFAVMYWDVPEGRMFLLISNEDGMDVAKIAAVYKGKGDPTLAAFKTPPQREVAGEFIPLDLEFPPDNIDVVALFIVPGTVYTFASEAHHVKDGKFDAIDAENIVAWAYMPELPAAIERRQLQ